MQRHKKTFISLVVVLAWSTVIYGPAYFSKSYRNEAPTRRDRRSLRITEYSKSKSSAVAPHVHVNSTISVYLVKHIGSKNNKKKPSYSTFRTDVLTRYGSGRFDYSIKTNTRCDTTCTRPLMDDGPCLAVSTQWDCDDRLMSCNYPQCKTMLVGDEICKDKSRDVRWYYSADIPNKGYLPLGPRLDSWKALQKIQLKPQFSITPASKRQFAFNAIFSQSTNLGRGKLAKIIDEQGSETDLPIFTHIAKMFSSLPNGPNYKQLKTGSYMKILLLSVFTLSPAGHNSECYRLYEAVEAGSIPVVVKSDLYITSVHRCRDALYRWYDAPILVLDSWKDLFPTVERLMNEPEALDEMQIKLRMWYDDFMRKTVTEFEDYMLESFLKDGAEKASIVWPR